MKKQKRLLLNLLAREGYSQEIISAFEKVRREDFVPQEFAQRTYENNALPIGEGATISQPGTIAIMLELLELKNSQKILEIGSGSGYVLALLAQIVADGNIFGVEINKKLAKESKALLRPQKNVQVIGTSGEGGLAKHAPFDRILASATLPGEKTALNLVEQLKEGGILVCPIGESIFQFKKQGREVLKKEIRGYVFVPLKTRK